MYNSYINEAEVANMLFRKKIQKSCEYCTHGTILENDQVLCSKHGLIDNAEKCRKFRYDLLKRAPKDKPRLGEFMAVPLDD
jgi:hypothetical protein